MIKGELVKKLKYGATWLSVMMMSGMNPVEVLASSSGTGGSGSSGGGTVDFSGAATPVVQLINSLLGPVISVVVAVAAVYCVILGVKLAKADEPQEREKAKAGLKNAVVGFFLIFILIVVMRIITPQLVTWLNNNRNGMTEIKVNY